MLEWENKIYLFVKKHRHLIRQWRELLGKKFFWVADLFFPAGIQYALSKTTRISSTQQQLNEYQCYRLEMYNFVNKSILSTKLLNIVQNYTCLLMLKYQKSDFQSWSWSIRKLKQLSSKGKLYLLRGWFTGYIITKKASRWLHLPLLHHVLALYKIYFITRMRSFGNKS